MKYGLEIEGRLRGIRSLILQFPEISALGAPAIMKIAQDYKAVHIQIDGFGFDVNEANEAMAYWVSEGYVVSIETDVIPFTKVDGVNYVLVIKDPNFFNLKPTDQIKFVDSNLNVCMIAVENMHYTHPSEFENDVVIDWKN